MIGSSGADALSRAGGDEQLQRIERTSNNPNQRRNQEGKRKRRKSESDTDEARLTSAANVIDSVEGQRETAEPRNSAKHHIDEIEKKKEYPMNDANRRMAQST